MFSVKISKYNNGFTLLELLVVIALISLIAAVIIASMSMSKSKGADGGVKSNLTNARSQAEVFYINSASNPKSYIGLCDESAVGGIWKHVQTAAKAYGKVPKATSYDNATASTWNTEECHANQNAYAVWVPLSDSTSGSISGWCVDSASVGKKVTIVLGINDYSCN